MRTAPKITKNCKICNKEFTVLLSRKNSYVNCSKECSSKNKANLAVKVLTNTRNCKTCKRDLTLSYFKKHESYILKNGEIKECYYRECKECKSIKKCGKSNSKKSTEREDLFNIGKRRCNRCNEVKELSNFGSNKNCPQNTAYNCRTCERNPFIKSKRSSVIKTKYNLEIEDYKNLFDNQKGQCAICLTEEKDLYVDHCHLTEKVRGLLCSSCNTGIGLLKDNTENLKRAINYLI